MELVDRIALEDLDEEQAQLADLIGIENYRKLIKVYAGNTIYIPKLDGIEKMVRNEKIRKEFNGQNYKYLSFKYRLTEVSIRTIVADIDRELKLKPIDGQLKF